MSETNQDPSTDLEFRRSQMRLAIQRLWEVELGLRGPASTLELAGKEADTKRQAE